MESFTWGKLTHFQVDLGFIHLGKHCKKIYGYTRGLLSREGVYQSNLPCSVRIQVTCFLPNREVNANHVRQRMK